ncbi:MAG: hypothetical protein V3V99_00170 [candidate division Zixibacteria bacterium]
MYRVYLEINQFAISMLGEELSPSGPEGSEKESLVSIDKRISRRYLWTYWFIYLVIYVIFIVPLVFLESRSDSMFDAVNFRFMLIGSMLFAILHGYIFYKRVIKYHKKNPTDVYRFGNLSYEDIYPKQLRRRLWLWNLWPFMYLTFAIVPIVTRIQHLVETLVLARVIIQKGEGGKDTDPRLSQYNLIKDLIQRKIHDYSETKAHPLGTLKKLFERRIATISTDVQRISIILSSLGIAGSLIAIIVKDPIATYFSQPSISDVCLIVSLAALIMGVIIYFISQLQIQVGQRRALSVVLDVIDIMLLHYEPENGAAQ